jgi:hypothetical protein
MEQCLASEGVQRHLLQAIVRSGEIQATGGRRLTGSEKYAARVWPVVFDFQQVMENIVIRYGLSIEWLSRKDCWATFSTGRYGVLVFHLFKLQITSRHFQQFLGRRNLCFLNAKRR